MASGGGLKISGAVHGSALSHGVARPPRSLGNAGALRENFSVSPPASKSIWTDIAHWPHVLTAHFAQVSACKTLKLST